MADLRLKLLAHVPDLDPSTKAYCQGPITPNSPFGAREGKFPYFRAGYVNTEIPRDSAYTTDIRTASQDYALADEKGNLIEGAVFQTFAEAEKARAGAHISLAVSVNVPAIQGDDSDDE